LGPLLEVGLARAGSELLGARDFLAIDADNDVVDFGPIPRRPPVGVQLDDNYAPQLRGADLAGDLRRDRPHGHAQLGDVEVALGRVLIAQGDADDLGLAVAEDFELHGRAGGGDGDGGPQAGLVHGLAVELGDDIALLHAGLLGGAVLNGVLDG